MEGVRVVALGKRREGQMAGTGRQNGDVCQDGSMCFEVIHDASAYEGFLVTCVPTHVQQFEVDDPMRKVGMRFERSSPVEDLIVVGARAGLPVMVVEDLRRTWKLTPKIIGKVPRRKAEMLAMIISQRCKDLSKEEVTRIVEEVCGPQYEYQTSVTKDQLDTVEDDNVIDQQGKEEVTQEHEKAEKNKGKRATAREHAASASRAPRTPPAEPGAELDAGGAPPPMPAICFVGRSVTPVDAKMLLPPRSTISLDERLHRWQVESKWRTTKPFSKSKAFVEAEPRTPGQVSFNGALRIVYEWAWQAYILANPDEVCPHNWDDILGPETTLAIAHNRANAGDV